MELYFRAQGGGIIKLSFMYRFYWLYLHSESHCKVICTRDVRINQKISVSMGHHNFQSCSKKMNCSFVLQTLLGLQGGAILLHD